MSKPSKAAALTSSWQLLPKSYELFRDNFRVAFTLLIVPTLLLQLGSTLALVAKDPAIYRSGLALQFVASIILLICVAAGTLLQIRVIRGKAVSVYGVVRDSMNYWLRIVGFSLLFAIMLAIGFVALIVPGLIVLRRYILTPYFLIEEDLPIRQAMQRSHAASYPIRKHVWTMLLIILGFSGIGFIFTKLSPEYGGFFAALLPIVYAFLPALRYKEAAANLNSAKK